MSEYSHWSASQGQVKIQAGQYYHHAEVWYMYAMSPFRGNMLVFVIPMSCRHFLSCYHNVDVCYSYNWSPFRVMLSTCWCVLHLCHNFMTCDYRVKLCTMSMLCDHFVSCCWCELQLCHVNISCHIVDVCNVAISCYHHVEECFRYVIVDISSGCFRVRCWRRESSLFFELGSKY